MLMDKVSHRPGDWVLIQAAASGTGVAALQIARLHGLRVIAVAGHIGRDVGQHQPAQIGPDPDMRGQSRLRRHR